MVGYSLIYFTLLIISLFFSNGSIMGNATRETFRNSLHSMNINTIGKYVCGILTLISAILPIIDSFYKANIITFEESNSFVIKSQIFGYDYGSGAGRWLLFSSYAFILGWMVFMLSRINKHNEKVLETSLSKTESRKARVESRLAEEKAEILAKEQAYDNAIADLIEKYGGPEKIIHLDYNRDLQKAIIAFTGQQMLLVQGKPVNYKDILSCTWSDNPYLKTTETGTSQSSTKNKTGNTIGRAIVGSVVAGPVGAIIGGATGKKNTTSTTTTNSSTETIHNYTVIINISDIANPIIRIKCGTQGEAVNEIVGMVNAIINLVSTGKSRV